MHNYSGRKLMIKLRIVSDLLKWSIILHNEMIESEGMGNMYKHECDSNGPTVSPT
jgi:hypothetical protein